MTKPFSLSKNERLKSKKDIDTLFLTGKAFFVFPFKIIFLQHKVEVSNAPLLFGITVSKRYFKKAVDRNKIKRLSREIYRVHKVELKNLLTQQQQQLRKRETGNLTAYDHYLKGRSFWNRRSPETIESPADLPEFASGWP